MFKHAKRIRTLDAYNQIVDWEGRAAPGSIEEFCHDSLAVACSS